MSSTNKTVTIELSQYIATDKPTYLVDYNGDMAKIDQAIADDRTSIATAQSTANEANGKADANATAIQTLNGELNDPTTGLAGKVTDLIGDVNTIESLIGNGTPTTTDKTIIGAINELKGDIDDFVGKKKFIFIGDSYAVGYVPGQPEDVESIPGFYTRVINRLGLTSDEYTTIKSGRSGFVAQGIDGKTWVQSLADLADDTDVTDIFVIGGMNDVNQNQAQVGTAIGTFVTTAKTKFPNANVHIGFCGRTSVASDTHTEVNMRIAIDTYRTQTVRHGASYLDNMEYALKYTGVMASDNAHPNDEGENLIADYVTNYIVGNQKALYHPHSFTNVTGTLSTAFGGGALSTWGQFIDDTQYHILWPNITEFTNLTITSQLLNFGTPIEVATLTNNFVNGDRYKTCGGPVTATILNSNNEFFDCTGLMYIKDNKLYLELHREENNVIITTDIVSIWLAPFHIAVPLAITV